MSYYISDREGIGALPAAVPVVTAAFDAITGGAAKRREEHIQDRMRQWANYSIADLQTILPRGGEAAEAARRLIQLKGGTVPMVGTTPTPEGPLIDLTKLVKLPEVRTTSKLEIPPMFLYGGLALAGVLLLATLGRRR